MTRKKLSTRIKRLFPSLAKLYRYRWAVSFLKRYPQVELSDIEKKEIKDYWGKFGIKFPDYSWFRMFYGVTGIHDPRFIPDPVALQLCYPYYNFKSHIAGWDDKNVYEKLVPHTTFPCSLVHCIRGSLYDHEWNCYGKERVIELSEKVFDSLSGENEIVIKPSCGSFQGKGVRLVQVNSVQDVCDLIQRQVLPNYIIQKRVIQHPFFSQFSSSSNIIRVISWRSRGGDINVLSATIRYGIEGYFTDVAFVDGKEVLSAVGIDGLGRVKDIHVSNSGVIPHSKDKIVDKDVPSWKCLIDTVKKAHADLIFFDFVGWDFMIDKKGSPICIEFNVQEPGTLLYQFANGPLAGEYTDSFLDFLKKKQSNDIPWLYRM